MSADLTAFEWSLVHRMFVEHFDHRSPHHKRILAHLEQKAKHVVALDLDQPSGYLPHCPCDSCRAERRKRLKEVT